MVALTYHSILISVVAFLGLSAYAVPLNASNEHALTPTATNGAPTFKIVTGRSKFSRGCTDEQVSAVQTAFKEAASQLAKANLLLDGVARVRDSNAVRTFIGTIDTPERLSAITTLHFKNPALAFQQPITSVSSLGTDDAMYLICNKDQTSDPCVSSSYAVTTNKAESNANNAIFFCDKFFTSTVSLDEDVKNYRDGPRGTAFAIPRNKGVVLAHEAQHSLPILQTTDKALISEDLADTPAACAALGDDDKKKNAENWALIAFLAVADEQRFAP